MATRRTPTTRAKQPNFADLASQRRVKYFHFERTVEVAHRFRDLRGRQTEGYVNYDTRDTVCVALDDNGVFHVGISMQSPRETHYNRRKGNRIAQGRVIESLNDRKGGLKTVRQVLDFINNGLNDVPSRYSNFSLDGRNDSYDNYLATVERRLNNLLDQRNAKSDTKKGKTVARAV